MQFDNAINAHIVVGKLESANIPYELRNEAINNVMPMGIQGFSITLLVPLSYAHAAMDVIYDIEGDSGLSPTKL